ncbi:MAG: efflux RND transporter periplasmic adaptor subunit [Saprospiraceae bacterium]
MNKGCAISLGLLLLLITLGLGYYFTQDSGDEPDRLETIKPKIDDIISKTVATGAIKPRQEVLIKPQVSGVIEQLYVEPGQIIKKGSKLAKVKLVPSEVNINSAQSSVELSKIRFKAAERELERQTQIYNQKLDVEDAKINYENAKREETRQRSLFDEGLISEVDYNRFKVDMEVRKASLDNAEIAAKNNLRQFAADVDIRKQEMNAAIDNLQLLREGATRNSGQVSNIVVSTVSGMLLDVPVEVGSSVIERNNFSEGTTIASVANMSSLIFEGNVDESDVGKLKEGMPLEMTVGAVENKKFAATLEYISPKGVIEEGTVKFEVRAAVKPTDDTFLRAGYSASADIILDRKDKVVVINERDLILKNDSTFVELKTADGFKRTYVKTGLSDGILVEITNGIDTSSQIKVIKGIED